MSEQPAETPTRRSRREQRCGPSLWAQAAVTFLARVAAEALSVQWLKD